MSALDHAVCVYFFFSVVLRGGRENMAQDNLLLRKMLALALCPNKCQINTVQFVPDRDLEPENFRYLGSKTFSVTRIDYLPVQIFTWSYRPAVFQRPPRTLLSKVVFLKYRRR